MNTALFCNYIHTRNDTGAVFYVGKGKERRAHTHYGRSQHWKRIVAKHGRTVHIVAYFANEADAFAKGIPRDNATKLKISNSLKLRNAQRLAEAING